MLQLIAHLLGDYVFQNNWMAINKGKHTIEGYIACVQHCVIYTLFFCWIFSFPFYSVTALIIFLSHFIIDKFKLPVLWLGGPWYNNPQKDIPVWLFIIVDNTLHLCCNYYALLIK